MLQEPEDTKYKALNKYKDFINNKDSSEIKSNKQGINTDNTKEINNRMNDASAYMKKDIEDIHINNNIEDKDIEENAYIKKEGNNIQIKGVSDNDLKLQIIRKAMEMPKDTNFIFTGHVSKEGYFVLSKDTQMEIPLQEFQKLYDLGDSSPFIYQSINNQSSDNNSDNLLKGRPKLFQDRPGFERKYVTARVPAPKGAAIETSPNGKQFYWKPLNMNTPGNIGRAEAKSKGEKYVPTYDSPQSRKKANVTFEREEEEDMNAVHAGDPAGMTDQNEAEGMQNQELEQGPNAWMQEHGVTVSELDDTGYSPITRYSTKDKKFFIDINEGLKGAYVKENGKVVGKYKDYAEALNHVKDRFSKLPSNK